MEQTACTAMQARIAAIRARMEDAARRAGRNPQEIRLCAACKTQETETVRASAHMAIDLFGENHVQELVEKYDAGAYEGKEVHFIGHLQTNKVKKVVGRADRVRLALVMVTAKLTSVGGTSSSSKLPLMLSLPPIEGSPRCSWAVRAPSRAEVGLPQRWGTSRSRSKYSWNVRRAFIGSAPTAHSFDKLSVTA